MKKFLLIAAIGVAGLVSAKSNSKHKFLKNQNRIEGLIRQVSTNTSKERKLIQECAMYINYYDDFGFIYRTEYRSSEQNTLSDCQKWHEVQKMMLRLEGYQVTP